MTDTTASMRSRSLNSITPRLFIPSVVVLVLFISEVIFSYNDEYFIGFPIYIAVPITAFIFLVIGAACIAQKKYANGISFLLSVPLFVFAFGFPPIYVINANFVSSYIKLTLNKNEYLSEIRRLQPDARGYKYKEFRGSSINPVIVYDESDEIASRQAYKTGIFWSKWGTSSDPKKDCVAILRQLKEHFYFVITNEEVC